MFKDFLKVLLPSRRPAALAAFYRDVMHLPAADSESCFAAGKAGFIEVLSESRFGPLFGPTALWLEAGYVDNTHRLLRHGTQRLLVELANTYYSAREYQILDPDGNISCVINYAKDLAQRQNEPQPALYGQEFRAVLYVKNLAACQRFYTETLGMECVYQWEENRGDRGYKYAVCPGGSVFVETLFREPLAIQRRAALVLRTAGIEACRHRLGAAAAWDGSGLSLCDPDGNLIRIEEG